MAVPIDRPRSRAGDANSSLRIAEVHVTPDREPSSVSNQGRRWWRNAHAMLDYDRLHLAIHTLHARQLFFVGGSVKSGTTWLQLLLDAHPQICCKGEGHFIDYFAPLLKAAFDAHGKLITEKNGLIFREIEGYRGPTNQAFLYILASCISVFLVEQGKGGHALAFGEKTPNNVRHFGLLGAMFPAAKFINVVRDGRDCAVSCWYHNQRVLPDWNGQKYGSLDAFVEVFAKIWAADIQFADEFAAQNPARIMQVRYEDLITDTETTLAGLLAFLGVDTSDDVLAHCAEAASFRKLSRGRDRGEEDRGSFFRNGLPGDWHRHLGDDAIARFQVHAGRYLDRFGYARHPEAGGTEPPQKSIYIRS